MSSPTSFYFTLDILMQATHRLEFIITYAKILFKVEHYNTLGPALPSIALDLWLSLTQGRIRPQQVQFQVAFKTGNFSIHAIYLFSHFCDLNDQLELLTNIRTPILNEWGTKCLGQILYFLFYLSSGTTGNFPRHLMMRVHHYGLSHGFKCGDLFLRHTSGPTSKIPCSLFLILSMAYLMEGPVAKLDHL